MKSTHALGVLCLSGLLPFSASLAQGEQFVVADYVKVRARPDPGAPAVAILPISTAVAVDRASGDGWVSIRFPADKGAPASGHVRAEFLQPQRPTLEQLQSNATDPAAPLETRVTWFERWLALEPDHEAALVALRDAYRATGKAREAEVVESRLTGDFPVHLGVCVLRGLFGEGGYPNPPFDAARKGDAFVLVASIGPGTGPKEAIHLPKRPRGTDALFWAPWPWRKVPGGEPVVFSTPRAVASTVRENEEEIYIAGTGGHLALGTRPCPEGELVASAVLRPPTEAAADTRNAARWRQEMIAPTRDIPGVWDALSREPMSARTITLGELRLTSVRIGPMWAVFDEDQKVLHRQGWGPYGDDRQDVGEVRWLVLPDRKRLLAVALYGESDEGHSTYGGGVTLLVVGPDRSVHSEVILLSGFTGG